MFLNLKGTSLLEEATLDAIIENSSQLHENMMLKEHCMVSDLPNSPLAIDVANVEAHFNVQKGIKKEQEMLLVIQEMKKVITETIPVF